MSREIRKETDWWGDEKEVIYEDNHRVGEIRTEETWGGFGPTVQRTYDTDGERISETRSEETWGGFGPTVQRTYDTDGKRISETRTEETWGGIGPTVQRTYDTDGERISEIRREETWGGFGPTVKREYDTGAGSRAGGNQPYNALSKYSPRKAFLDHSDEVSIDQAYSGGVTESSGSGAASNRTVQRGGSHRQEHRQDHRRRHVQDHR